MFNASFSGLAYGHSCVYRAYTTCGNVRASFLVGPAVKATDFDIAYGYGEWPENADLDPTAPNTTFFSDENSKSMRADESNGGYLQIAKPKNETIFNACNGPNTNLYVIVTRTSK